MLCSTYQNQQFKYIHHHNKNCTKVNMLSSFPMLVLFMYHIKLCQIFFSQSTSHELPSAVAAVCFTLCTVAAQRNDYWSGSAAAK